MLVEKEIAPDQALQSELLGPTKHPATNSLTLVNELLATFTEPGDLVVDPMAGTGATGLLAARVSRDAICMDCEPELVAWGSRRWIEISAQTSIVPYGEFSFIEANACAPWPIERAADAIIFSPPFLDQLPSDGRPPEQWDNMLNGDRSFEGTRKNLGRTYGVSDCNLGLLKELDAWELAMQDVLSNALGALKREGTLAIIMRNVVRGGEVVPLVDYVAGYIFTAGFELFEMWRRALTHRSMFSRMREKRGEPVVLDEFVLLARPAASAA